jgi:hypothetical protein
MYYYYGLHFGVPDREGTNWTVFSCFREALSVMDLSEFQPQVNAEATQSEAETAEEAAISTTDGPSLQG